MHNVDVNTRKARTGRRLVATAAVAMLFVAGCSTSGSDAENVTNTTVATTAAGPDDTTATTVEVPDTTEAPETTTSTPDTTVRTIPGDEANEVGAPYPAQVQTNFTTSCVGNGGDDVGCQCLLDELTAQLSLNDFIQLEADMTATGETPDILTEAVETCVG